MLPAPRVDGAGFERAEQRAARLAVVAAVAEAAAPQVRAELDEGLGEVFRSEVGEPEDLQAGAVDQPAAAGLVGGHRQAVQASEGRGVLAGVERVRDLAGGGLGLGHDGVGQGRFAHARLAHEDRLQAGQASAQRIRTLQRRHLDDLVAELAEGLELATRGLEARGEVGLVEHDQGHDALTLGCGDAARHQQVGEARLGGDHDHQVAEVGGDQLLAEGIRAPQQVAARVQGLDDALAVAAGHQLDLVAAGVAALLSARIALQPADRGVDLVVATEGSDDQTVDSAFGDGAGVAALAHAAHRCSACRRAMRSAAGGCESWKREYSGSGVSVEALSR